MRKWRHRSGWVICPRSHGLKQVVLSRQSKSVRLEILASFSDSHCCSGRWLLFIYILIRHFSFTPFWGKTGTLISKGHLYQASVPLRCLPVFETLSPVRWGRSSPCGNRLSGGPSDITDAKRFAQSTGRGGCHYTGVHCYAVPSGPGLPVIITFASSGQTSRTDTGSNYFLGSATNNFLQEHLSSSHLSIFWCPVGVTLYHQVSRLWAGSLWAFISQQENDAIVTSAWGGNSNQIL